MSNLEFVDTDSSDESVSIDVTFPPLYKTDARDNLIEWKIWTVGSKIYHTFGKVGGKMREPIFKDAEATRVGMSNERSAEEQAEFEADSKWRKQLEKDYRPDPKDKAGIALYNKVVKEKKSQGGTNHKASESNRAKKPAGTCQDKHIVDVVVRPTKIMKAHPFQSHKHKIKFSDKPFVQPKFDGVRCIANAEKQPNGETVGVMTTSSGKQFLFLKHIKDSLAKVLKGSFANVILDGECYSHNLVGADGEELDEASRFNAVTGACRSVRSEPHPLESQMELHVFDIKDTSTPQDERFKLLDKLFDTIDVSLPLRKAPTYEIESEDEVYEYHDKFFEMNYEGVMIRNRFAKYSNSRTPNIQKYKQFTDEECEIVGAKAGKGTEEGAVVWICKYTPGGLGKKFECRPRGSMEERRRLFEDRDNYIGKQLTVKYQALTCPAEKGGVPRFPVGIAIRDYE